MLENLPIYNDIPRILECVDSLGADISHKFNLMMKGIVDDLIGKGYDDLGVLLSDRQTNPAVFWSDDPGEYAEHEIYFVHIYVASADGRPNVNKFVAIDKTDGEVYDCSENITYRH